MTTTLTKNRVRDIFPGKFGDFDYLFGQLLGSDGAGSPFGWQVPASLWEADDKIHVELDVPGTSQENVDLTYDKGVLKIDVERKAPEGDHKQWHNERAFGKVTRNLMLPESADPDSIGAELNDGVLHVTIAKRADAQPKRISIKTA